MTSTMNRAKLAAGDCAGCTPEGKEWLTMAIDPFHDYTVELMGYPDADASPSFVLVHKEQLTVQAPTTGTGTWGCHVSMPGFTSLTPSPTFGYSNFVTSTTTPPTQDTVTGFSEYKLPVVSGPNFGMPFGPIQACTYIEPVAAPGYHGTAPWSFQSTVDTNTYAFGESTQTACRIIGMAFEVHDTTPKLYQQGSVLCYQASRSRVKEFHWLMDPATQPVGIGNYVSDSDILVGPPNSLQQAAVIPSSKTWEASKGCYVVARMADDVELDPSTRAGGQWHAIAPCNSVGGVNIPAGLYVAFGSKGFNAFAPSGAIFSGLNLANGALTINVRIIYEYFPQPNVGDPFLPLCTPSAPYDATIMQHYSRLVRSLPPGVPVAMNNAGDWFRMVLKVLAESKIPSYISPLFGAGLRAVNSLVNNQGRATTTMLSANPPRRRRLLPRRGRPRRAAPKRLPKK